VIESGSHPLSDNAGIDVELTFTAVLFILSLYLSEASSHFALARDEAHA